MNFQEEKVMSMSDENNLENEPVHNIEDEDLVLDMSAIMRMASNLLQDESFTNSLKDFSQEFIQIPIFENWMDNEVILLTKEEMQQMVNELNEVKSELAKALAISESLKRELDEERAKSQGEQQ